MPRKKKAVALKYNLEQDPAPVVIASGYGEVAERIINIAEERGIPVYRDDSAASMLCMLEVGATIPEDLYQIVATIYIQIMETANRVKEGVNVEIPKTSSSRTFGAREQDWKPEREQEPVASTRVFGPTDPMIGAIAQDAPSGGDTPRSARISRRASSRNRRGGAVDEYSEFLTAVLGDEGEPGT